VIVEKVVEVEVERFVRIPVPMPAEAPAATRRPRMRRRAVPSPTAAAKPARKPRRPRTRPMDDLERIHGVGPKLAKFLNERGVTQFRQVARWQDADMDRFEAELPQFKGRIRREGWVASAAAEHRMKYGRDV
jgi:NADH-quinone oxidoreductase subunit E